MFTPAGRKHGGKGRPVIVWIHGGFLWIGASDDYDPAKLAADGTVVVTINYRLGALGFLAHPALPDRPGGSSGAYGLMDQQAALRWVQRNIPAFGGDPRKVTIAGESAGGLSVLAHVASPRAHGLFSRAIVQSGAYALTQAPLEEAETAGEAFAAKVGCASQTAACLRDLPLSTIQANDVVPVNVYPGVVGRARHRRAVRRGAQQHELSYAHTRAPRTMFHGSRVTSGWLAPWPTPHADRAGSRTTRPPSRKTPSS